MWLESSRLSLILLTKYWRNATKKLTLWKSKQKHKLSTSVMKSVSSTWTSVWSCRICSKYTAGATCERGSRASKSLRDLKTQQIKRNHPPLKTSQSISSSVRVALRAHSKLTTILMLRMILKWCQILCKTSPRNLQHQIRQELTILTIEKIQIWFLLHCLWPYPAHNNKHTDNHQTHYR